MNTDRLPPHHPESERAIVGAAILDPSRAPDLRGNWFYNLDPRLAEMVQEAAAAGLPADAVELTVRDKARAAGIAESDAIITECIDLCHSPANWGYWAEILTEKEQLRRVVQVASQSLKDAMEPGAVPADVLDAFERDALGIRRNGDRGAEEIDMRATLAELVNDYEKAHRGDSTGRIDTGFSDLDRMLGGLKPQQLIVLAARPAVGKTSLALNIAQHVAVDGNIPVAFFSLEMSGKEQIHRLTCSIARIDCSDVASGRISEPSIRSLAIAQRNIIKSPLHICDRGGLTISRLTALSRRMVQRHSVKLVVVDYLGLLRSGEKGRSRYEETSAVSNGLKTLAKELGLPVLALCQLNRDTDREGRAPRLSDLRDSGAIEQDADAVLLLHRDEGGTGDAPVNLIVAKHRNGPTGAVPLVFMREFTRFESASRVS